MVKFLPNSSPSSIVAGRAAFMVSGSRNAAIPPSTETMPIMINGTSKWALPYAMKMKECELHFS